MIDVPAITLAVWRRLAVDVDGAAVRALLGDAANSVMMAQDLRLEVLRARALPARPLVALRRATTPTVERVVVMPTFIWYTYDDTANGYGRLDALPLAFADAFRSPMRVPSVGVGSVDVGTGEHLYDGILGLLMCPITVTIGAV